MGKNDTIHSFYEEEKNQIDVIFIGSSHAYSSFSPMELWNDTGISSYNLGSSSQSIPCSYYLIKECIRTQHPKVIVLESYGAKYDADYVSEPRLHVAIDGIPYNETKWELFTEFLPRTMNFHERLNYYFPIISFHSRWKDLKPEDFNPQNIFLKGYHISGVIKEQAEPQLELGKTEVYSGTLEYLQRIIDLCDENEVELILCNTPMGMNKKYAETNQKVNTLFEYVSARNIACINFELLREEIGLDYRRDFRDNEHLNMYGMRKIHTYLSDYLMQNYELGDHRNDPAYQKWNDDYKSYEEMVIKKEAQNGHIDEDEKM